MTSLGFGASSGPTHGHHQGRTRGINWQTTAAVTAAIIALLLWFGVSPRSYADQIAGLSTKVSALEANRVNDVERVKGDEDRMKRIEDTEREIDGKVDLVLEKLAK